MKQENTIDTGEFTVERDREVVVKLGEKAVDHKIQHLRLGRAGPGGHLREPKVLAGPSEPLPVLRGLCSQDAGAAESQLVPARLPAALPLRGLAGCGGPTAPCRSEIA